MISQKDMYARLRKLIGQPSVDQRNERDLLEQLRMAVSWIAAELEFSVVTADLLTITASDYDYDLPDDLGQLLWVEYGTANLEPGNISRWTRDAQNWRGATASSPTQYAIQGRQLLIYPKPSSGAVTTDSVLTISYISHSPRISASGVPYLTEADLQVALHRAAWSWCGFNPGANEVEMAQRAAMKAMNAELLDQTLKQALRRSDDPVKNYPHKVRMRGIRQGAAR